MAEVEQYFTEEEQQRRDQARKDLAAVICDCEARIRRGGLSESDEALLVSIRERIGRLYDACNGCGGRR